MAWLLVVTASGLVGETVVPSLPLRWAAAERPVIWTRVPADDQGFQLARDFLGQLTAMYPTGTRVQITGLSAAAHLNGRLGTTVTPPAPLAAGRIAVQIDGQTKSVSLSWVNLRRA